MLNILMENIFNDILQDSSCIDMPKICNNSFIYATFAFNQNCFDKAAN